MPMDDPELFLSSSALPYSKLSCGLLLALFLLLITRNVSSEPYVYDEADYMYAASTRLRRQLD